MTNKYQPMYEHDYYKIDATDILKRPTKEQLEKSVTVKAYNGFYKRLLDGDRSSAVLKELDKLQGKINGEDIN